MTEPQVLAIDSIADLDPVFVNAGATWWLHCNHLHIPDVLTAFTERPPEGVQAVTLGECWSIGEAPESLRALELCPELDTLELIWCDLTDSALTTLAALELPALTNLVIADEVPPAAFHVLTQAAWWHNLRALRLEGSWLARADIETLFGVDMPALRELELEVEEAAPILLGPRMPHLESIGLTVVSQAGLENLDRPVSAPRLTEFALYAVSPLPVATIADFELPALQRLVLGQAAALGTPGACRVGDDGAALIAKTWPELRALHLHDAGIGPAGARALGEHLSGPESLVLSFNALGNAGVRELVPCLSQVTRLVLHHCHLDGDAIATLRPFLGQLEELHIRGNPIGRHGAQILVATPMPALDRLWLSGCRVGPEGYALLKGCERFSRLSFFELPAAAQGPPERRRSWLSSVFGRLFAGRR